MVQLSGKYKITDNGNYEEFLVKVGLPAAQAKAASNPDLVISVTVDDKKFDITYEDSSYKTSFEYGKEVSEKLPMKADVKSIATRNGNAVKVVSKDGDNSFNRTYTFTDAGMEMTISNGSSEGKRIFKRL